MSKKKDSDYLVKAVADGVRVYAAVTTNLVNEAISRHKCRHVAGAALGRTMTGALLFAANLKNKEAITITFDGHGPLGKVTADATPEGYVRGMVTHPEIELPLNPKGKIDVGGGVGRDGLVKVTRFTGLKNVVTGSTNIVDGEIADDLIRYLMDSEQTPSSVGLGVLIAPDYHCVGAGGFLLQPMPDATDETIDRLEKNIKTISSVSKLVQDGLSAEEMIGVLLKGFSYEILSKNTLSFHCKCSKERVEEVLSSLSLPDLKKLVEDGQAEITCEFCQEKYHFTGDELTALYKRATQLH